MDVTSSGLWGWYHANIGDITPLLAPLATLAGTLATLAAGVFLARAAITQAKTATTLARIAATQAETASERHKEQTLADKQRRISESFAKAAEQLGSDKIEARLGGIYTLERISQESSDDYWTVMETLTAFLRERSQRNYAEYQSSQERISRRARELCQELKKPEDISDKSWAEAIQTGELPAADIAAVLTVIKRRSDKNREREGANWHLDLSDAILNRAHLEKAPLRGIQFQRAHLKGANLNGADLTDAIFWEAHLQGASLDNADLKDVDLRGAHLQGTWLRWPKNASQNVLDSAYRRGAITDAHHHNSSEKDLEPKYPSMSWITKQLTAEPGIRSKQSATMPARKDAEEEVGQGPGDLNMPPGRPA